MKERRFCEDSPDDSDNYQLRIRQGDLLILGTDGVFDNLFEEEILEIVLNFTRHNNLKTKITAQILSRLIAEAAFQKSKMASVKTPFSIRKAQLIVEHRARAKSSNYSTLPLSP